MIELAWPFLEFSEGGARAKWLKLADRRLGAQASDRVMALRERWCGARGYRPSSGARGPWGTPVTEIILYKQTPFNPANVTRLERAEALRP